jgi:ferric-dicitrate binding protein FerR (iron transport regulator)
MRDAELQKIQDHYYRVKSKLLSCDKEEFFERARKVDTHILAAFQEVNDVQDAPQSTVAHRYRDDPKRRQRAPTPSLKRQAAGGGCSATSTRTTPAAAGKTSYAVIHISDSDELEVFEEENRGGGAPSSD